MPSSKVTMSLAADESIRLAAVLLLIGASLAPNRTIGAQKGPTPAAAQPLVLERQGSFFVGGQLRHTIVDGNKAGLFDLGNEDDVMVNQMYVQYQIPQNHGAHLPLVLIHGGSLSGKTWETTPDGRMGWSEYLVRRGWPVYVPDQTSRGRSGFDATLFNKAKADTGSSVDLPRVLTIGRYTAWKLFRFGPEYPNAFADQQFPVAAFDEFAKQVIPDLNATVPTPNPTFANLSSLAAQLKGAVLIGHSESAFFPQRAAMNDPSGVRGIISIEGSCPTNLAAQELSALARIPTVFVWGDHVEDSPVPAWKSAFTACQQLVKQLVGAGGDATMLHLPKVGLKGNSHMLMQDLNNLKVADLLLDWVRKHVRPSR